MLSNPSLRLGWIGLGSMGLGMAKNLQKHILSNQLPPLCYFNRTISRGAPLDTMGATPCKSIASIIENCDVIFISVSTVSDDEVLKSVVQEILAAGDLKGKIIIDTTTVHPDTSTTVSEKLQAAGASFVAAPVFGASPLAETGQLLMAIAGPPPAISKITPFLQGVLARNVLQVGTSPSQALLLKTTSNYLTAGLMYLISEAHVFASLNDLPASVLETLIHENFGTMAFSDSRRMTQGVYLPSKGGKPYSDLDLGIKDLGIGMEVAKEKGMRLRVGECVVEAMGRAREEGVRRGRQLDSSSMFGIVRMDAGLEFETEGVKERDMENAEGMK